MQWRGWLPADSPALAESTVFDMLANYVYLHTSIQTQDVLEIIIDLPFGFPINNIISHKTHT